MFLQEISLLRSLRLQNELTLEKEMLFFWVRLVPESLRRLLG
jgi:hypothetical protein